MKKYIVFTIIFILVAGYLLLNKNSGTMFSWKTKELIQKTKCKLEHKEWVSCLGAFGPCGCKTVYLDGGKLCQNGKNCSDGICRISKETKPDINGLYTGECHKYSNDTGCGYATIENGKIVEDRRTCLY